MVIILQIINLSYLGSIVYLNEQTLDFNGIWNIRVGRVTWELRAGEPLEPPPYPYGLSVVNLRLYLVEYSMDSYL
jgi:hypothetical protein